MICLTRKSFRSAWALCVVLLAAVRPVLAQAPTFHSQPIFPAEHKHNHASCVIQPANGQLLAVWYSGSGERKSDDVEIQGARLISGEAKWGPRFVVADTP